MLRGGIKVVKQSGLLLTCSGGARYRIPVHGCSCQLSVASSGRATSSTGSKRTVVLSKGMGYFGALGHSPELLDSEKYKEVSGHIVPRQSSAGASVISAGWGHSAIIEDSGGVLNVFGRPFDFKILLQIHRFAALSRGFARMISKASTWFGQEGKESGLFLIPQPLKVSGESDADGSDDAEGTKSNTSVWATPVRSVRCSAAHTTVLTEDGQVYCFGSNRWGQCAVEQHKDDQGIHFFDPVPVMLPGLVGTVASIDSGLQHCIALSTTGQVFVWGKGNHGQLGNGTFESSNHPLLVTFPKNERVVISSVSAGFAHTAALSNNGDVFVWGKSMSIVPKSGNPFDAFEHQLAPRKLSIPGNLKAVEICSR
jgi:Regulator of chromosome condensation (RCC1) repeat